MYIGYTRFRIIFIDLLRILAKPCGVRTVNFIVASIHEFHRLLRLLFEGNERLHFSFDLGSFLIDN